MKINYTSCHNGKILKRIMSSNRNQIPRNTYCMVQMSKQVKLTFFFRVVTLVAKIKEKERSGFFFFFFFAVLGFELRASHLLGKWSTT
jgi:hypothetical protein